MGYVTPMGALARGLGAGIAGSFAIGMFFERTGAIAPAMPQDAMKLREEKQAQEQPTETVARRAWEDFMKLGPLTDARKAQAGQAVHFAFGGGWGALYGLVRETIPALRGPLGGLLFGTVVWSASDHAILPAFGLAPRATKMPVKNHAYFWAAHLVYGISTWAAYEALRPSVVADLAAGMIARVKRPTWKTRVLRAMKPVTERVMPVVSGYAAGLADATAP